MVDTIRFLLNFEEGPPATIPMVMYIWLMELVKPLVMVPMLMRNPPIITTGWNPNRLVITEERGAEEGESLVITQI